MVQIKVSTEKPPLVDQKLRTLKTFFGVSVLIPLLSYLNFIFSEYEIVASLEDSKGRESQLGMGLWQLIMISMQLGLSIIYTGHKTLIKLYRVFFFGISLLSIFFGAGVMVRRFMIELYHKDPLFEKKFSEKSEIFRWEEYLAETIFSLVGLIVNVVMLMVLYNYGWLRHQNDEKKIKNNNFWNFQVYSEWVFYSHFISVFLSLATILANFFIMIQINSFATGDAFRSTGFGEVTILYGLFACKNCIMSKLDFDDDIEEKPTNKSLA